MQIGTLLIFGIGRGDGSREQCLIQKSPLGEKDHSGKGGQGVSGDGDGTDDYDDDDAMQ